MAIIDKTTHRIATSPVTRFNGEINLTPIEYSHFPDEVMEHWGFEFGKDIPVPYAGYIDMSTFTVHLCIGDYINVSFPFGGNIDFDNSKGYGKLHWHSYIESLPVNIISDIMGLLWPKL